MTHLSPNIYARVENKKEGLFYGYVQFLGSNTTSSIDKPELQFTFVYDPNFLNRDMFDLAVIAAVEHLVGYVGHKVLNYGDSYRINFSLKLEKRLRYADGFTSILADKLADSIETYRKLLAKFMKLPAVFSYYSNLNGEGTLSVHTLSELSDWALLLYLKTRTDSGLLHFASDVYGTREQAAGRLHEWLVRSLIA